MSRRPRSRFGGARASCGGDDFVVLRRGVSRAAALVAETDARVVLGGEPVDGGRDVWWNFVSSTTARIEQAKADWKAERFPPSPAKPSASVPE